MQRMLIGVDGSTAGMAALRWGSSLASATGCDLSLVHAFRPPYIEVGPDQFEKLVAERRDEIAEWIESTCGTLTGVDLEVFEDDPRVVIARAAERTDADLVVLGRTGRNGRPGYLHIGSVVEHAAHELGRPLAVVPADGPAAIGRIVLGLDGSTASSAAARWTADVAAATGAEVLVVTVREPIVEWTPSWDEHNWRRDALSDLETWSGPLSETGVTTEPIAVENLYPADGLLGIAARREADLVVVGTRGIGGFLGLRFGGVAMKVLHRATLPIVMVPEHPGE